MPGQVSGGFGVPSDAELVRRTLAEIAPVADRVTGYFYALLFIRNPDLRGQFPVAMDVQRDRLVKALLKTAELMESPDELADHLRSLGRGHRKYGTLPEHYPAVGEALIGALAHYAHDTWDEASEAAWTRAYGTMSTVMIEAAAENARKAPPWWQAEVVTHVMRASDIAEITLRTDRPYGFLPGQYASVETPWWPRIWRQYSFAALPGGDGLLTFHVRAVPTGWVSNALVHRARPGSVLRLGPPEGSMVVDHRTDSGIVCLGGGTGIAPVKAIVEDVVERDVGRPVEVFYVARSDAGLYAMDPLLRLRQRYPRLHVRAVVGDEFRVADFLREHGPWHGYDAYVSGPVGMVRTGVEVLESLGVSPRHLMYDPLETLLPPQPAP
ncbi:globin domain-containing protein [Streptomyces sp. NPDC047981]|uniref:globin domain-containing protein n=1 Tax=Streptomyces sp. NPDC047981 TaxID=3154610 RepID=UPI00343E48E6